jgi:hypothetical protein
MTRPYFPPPGGAGEGGYREAAPKPLAGDDPAQDVNTGDELGGTAHKRVIVTRPDEPEIARAKAEYGTPPPPPAPSLLWLRIVLALIVVVMFWAMLSVSLNAVLHIHHPPPPPPAPRATPP